LCSICRKRSCKGGETEKFTSRDGRPERAFPSIKKTGPKKPILGRMLVTTLFEKREGQGRERENGDRDAPIGGLLIKKLSFLGTEKEKSVGGETAETMKREERDSDCQGDTLSYPRGSLLGSFASLTFLEEIGEERKRNRKE